jgi:glucose-1-phosphate cytidylyltransferase
LEQHQRLGKTVTLTSVQPGGRYGVLHFEDDTETVTGFQEKMREDGGWINAGFMVLEPNIFNYLDGDDCVLEGRPLVSLAREKRLAAFRHYGFWQCMDTQRDKESLEKLWQTNHAAWKVW